MSNGKARGWFEQSIEQLHALWLRVERKGIKSLIRFVLAIHDDHSVGFHHRYLLYADKPILLSSDSLGSQTFGSTGHHQVKLLTFLGSRAANAEKHKKEKKEREDSTGFLFQHSVLVASGEVCKGVEWSSFNPKLYAPCKVVKAKPQRYEHLSRSGMRT